MLEPIDDNNTPFKPKRRPLENKFSQQKLYACRPIYTFWQIFSLLLFFGLSFVPIGYFMLRASYSVKSVKVNYYDTCEETRPRYTVQFNVTEDLKGEVYFYYGLDNYYANSRRFASGFSDRQLSGQLDKTDDCSDYSRQHISGTNETECPKLGGYWSRPTKPIPYFFENILASLLTLNWKFNIDNSPRCFKNYGPCGVIANAMFNDTFTLLNYHNETVPWTFDGLLYNGEDTRWFKNPEITGNQTLCDVFNKSTVNPKSWSKNICELDLNNPENNGFQNFDFKVWMRHPAQANFRKNYRKLDRNFSNLYTDGLQKGEYRLLVENNYNVCAFRGKKYFYISTSSIMGGQNHFLGYAYIVVGTLCLIWASIFALVHYFYGNSFDQIAHMDHNCL